MVGPSSLELQHLSLKDDAYIEDSQEGRSECAHLLYEDSSCVGSNIGSYRQLMRELPTVCLCMQALTVV